MEQGLVLSNREITPTVWNMLSQMAPIAHVSRLFGTGSPEQAIAIMMKGYELGLSVSSSFEFIQVIQGKPSLSPRGALALIQNSKEIEKLSIEPIEKNGKFFGYSCTMKRVNGFEYTATFTMDDAVKAGLVKPDGGWDKYPRNMCMWRAIGFCADVVAPDITGGLTTFMKMPEEMPVKVTDEGNFINAQFTPEPVKETFDVNKAIKEMGFEVDEPKAKTAVTVAPKAITLNELLSTFGAEEILRVNAGKIPATDKEVSEVATKLLGG